MFRNQQGQPIASRPAAGGAEYGAAAQPPSHGLQRDMQPYPAPPPLSSRPMPGGHSPAQSVEAQLSGLLDSVSQPGTSPPLEENEIILSKAYIAHGEPVKRFKIRKPTTREIRECGVPLKLNTDENGRIVDVEMKWDVIAKYVVLLSEPPLPASTVDQFEFFDLDACGAVIRPFFVRLAPSRGELGSIGALSRRTTLGNFSANAVQSAVLAVGRLNRALVGLRNRLSAPDFFWAASSRERATSTSRSSVTALRGSPTTSRTASLSSRPGKRPWTKYRRRFVLTLAWLRSGPFRVPRALRRFPLEGCFQQRRRLMPHAPAARRGPEHH